MIASCRHMHGAARRALALAATLYLASACSGEQVQRLEGEPRTTAPWTEPLYEPLSGPKDGVVRLVRALRDGQAELAWKHLSATTRAALRARADEVGLRGVDLLQPSPAGKSPAQRAAWQDPLAVFALPGKLAYEVEPHAQEPHIQHDGRRLEATVIVRGAGDRERTVTMRFEGTVWRVHHPALSRFDDASAPAPAGKATDKPARSKLRGLRSLSLEKGS